MKKILLGLLLITFFVITFTIALNSQEIVDPEQAETPVDNIKQKESKELNQILREISNELQNYEVFLESEKDLEYSASKGITIPTTLVRSNSKNVEKATEMREMVEHIFKKNHGLLKNFGYSNEVDILDDNGESIFQ
ncbi:hypothetical protein CEY16_06440 [Halalkalibacillus sediminis]|uniref:Uncharacterized protein n=1 Tax=Halalkalibacillus sediminis TaxID=2018042 RepID=A0A2I0QTA5_9BACI|nr:hypothetical protein [Halalkalibacillus sediminis]PKR77573.1 hypothetical protein CEY16_06440 [Halalkalibacillus sediminis]